MEHQYFATNEVLTCKGKECTVQVYLKDREGITFFNLWDMDGPQYPFVVEFSKATPARIW